jgi:hypothetical protein
LRLRLGGADAALALFDEPAGDHGIGVFVEPLVEEGRDLLAEIGDVAEAREFVGLQSVAGGGKEELPRRLSAMVRHCDLQYGNSYVLLAYSSTENSIITSNREVNALWKCVENKENPLAACSGCAGDYEDPDRSAWEEEFEEEEAAEVGDEPGSDK